MEGLVVQDPKPELQCTYSDEDITSLEAHADPPTVMQGPMTRARMRQLNLEVSSFLSDPFHTFENRLLPNDVILLRNIGEGHDEDITPSHKCQGEEEVQHGRPIHLSHGGGPVQLKLELISGSRTSLS